MNRHASFSTTTKHGLCVRSIPDLEYPLLFIDGVVRPKRFATRGAISANKVVFRGGFRPKTSFISTSSGSPPPLLHDAPRSETPLEAVQLWQGVTHKYKCHKCTAFLWSLSTSILLLLCIVYVHTRYHTMVPVRSQV